MPIDTMAKSTLFLPLCRFPVMFSLLFTFIWETMPITCPKLLYNTPTVAVVLLSLTPIPFSRKILIAAIFHHQQHINNKSNGNESPVTFAKSYWSVCHWIGLRENLNRKPWFLSSNWLGFPVNFPIIQFYVYVPILFWAYSHWNPWVKPPQLHGAAEHQKAQPGGTSAPTATEADALKPGNRAPGEAWNDGFSRDPWYATRYHFWIVSGPHLKPSSRFLHVLFAYLSDFKCSYLSIWGRKVYVYLYICSCVMIFAHCLNSSHTFTRSARNGKRMKRKRDKALEKSNMLTILRGVCMCIYIYMCVCVYVILNIHTYTYTHRHIYIYIIHKYDRLKCTFEPKYSHHVFAMARVS